MRPAVLLVATLLAAAACGGEEPRSDGRETGSVVEVGGGLEANDHGRAEVGGEGIAEVALGDVYFEPTVLVGEAGQAARVALENVGDVDHTFTIEEQSVDVALRPGERGDAEVVFPDSGALVFVCRFHAEAGMRGALSVGGDLGEGSSGEVGGGGYGGGGAPGPYG